MSATNMTILGFLMYKPMHGYEFKREIQCRSMELWAGIKLPAIYKALPRLEEDGYILGELIKGDTSPDKKVYEITESGKKYLRKIVLKKLFDMSQPKGFWLALVFINGVIKLSEFKDALEQQYEFYYNDFIGKKEFRKNVEEQYFSLPFNWQAMLDMGTEFSYYNTKMFESLQRLLTYKENQEIFLQE